MACYVFIFKDTQDPPVEQSRMGGCTGQVFRLADGTTKAAESILVGDTLFAGGLWPRRVDEIQVE